MRTLAFNGYYNLTVNLDQRLRDGRPMIPTSVYCGGGLNVNDPYKPRFEMAVGDYILMNWEPGGVAQFNKYGLYGSGNENDNLTAEDFKADFFKELVGPFGPTSVEDVSETKIAG